MQIGIISDTHDRLPTLRAALERLNQLGVQTIIHPGDVVAPFAAKLLADAAADLHITYGNNDGERAGLRKILPGIQDGPLWMTAADKQILVHHFVDWCRPVDVAQADIVITGHTHEVAVERRGDKLFINPGECCGWVTGRATIATLDLTTNEVQIIEVPT